MNDHSGPAKQPPIFHTPEHQAARNPIPSSSPAFGTPAFPIRPLAAFHGPAKSTILPVLLPPPTLRPLAFRTFTKKHNLTLTSSALQGLASFIGKHCGTGWREEGLAEGVLEEIAKSWKKINGGVLVDGENREFKEILKSLEACMSGGRLIQGKSLRRHTSFALGPKQDAAGDPADVLRVARQESQPILALAAVAMDDEEYADQNPDPRRWLKVIDAFAQPRLVYNVGKKHFDRNTAPPSLFPQPSHKTQHFRHRYSLIHQRLMRNESFQAPMFPAARVPSLQRSSSNLTTQQQSYKITPISNLLGRSGSSHLILGLLTIAPTGTLAIGDLSGSIALDLKQSRPVPEDGAWFTPGMIVLVDGMYEEEYNASAGGLGGGGGVGGTIGGKFIGFTIGGPPCERRDTTLGVSNAQSETEANSGAGFGWVDFLGVGSERAMGSKMRRLERQIFRRTTSVDAGEGRGRIAILGEVSLDNPKTLEALKKVLSKYATDSEGNAPMAIVLMGNFVTHAVMAGGGSGGSIEYKEYFDALASVLSEFPTLLQSATFIFVPGDKDPWASAFSAGASTAIPRKGVPDLFTSRVKRAFASANSESEKATGSKTDGEAIWTTNPTRLSLFGPSQEIVIFRDNLLGRLRRNAITFKPAPSSSAAPAHPNANHNTSVDNDVEMGEASVPVEQNSALGGSDSAAGGVTAEIAIARKLVKTILDQGHLSPFPLSIRPVLWDHSNVLQLYPMPTALVLADPEAPAFALTYEGCHAMNAGSLLSSGRRNIARWLEFDSRRGRGKVREVNF